MRAALPCALGTVVAAALGGCLGRLAARPSDVPDPPPDAYVEPGVDADLRPPDAYVSPTVDAGMPPALDTNVPTPTGMRSVFFSGHSLINLNTPVFFSQLSQMDSRPVNYQLQMGLGSPMSVRLACPRNGQQADGNAISYDVLTELARPRAYDTLVVTERHDIIDVILYEVSTSMARRFRDAFRAGNPDGQAFLFESWFYRDRPDMAAFRTRQERELVAWQCLASKVNESRGSSPPMLVVPVGQAVSYLATEIQAGRATGISNLSVLFNDNVHLTNVGNYFVSLIHYGVVHRRSPVGLPHAGLRPISDAPPSMSADTAAYLQRVAAMFVDRTFADAALSQRSDAECASLLPAACVPLHGAGPCGQIVSAFRNVDAAIPNHSWCR